MWDWDCYSDFQTHQPSFSWQEGTGGPRRTQCSSPSQAGTGWPSCPQPGHPEAMLHQDLSWSILALWSPGDPEWRLPAMQAYEVMKRDSPEYLPLPVSWVTTVRSPESSALGLQLITSIPEHHMCTHPLSVFWYDRAFFTEEILHENVIFIVFRKPQMFMHLGL